MHFSNDVTVPTSMHAISGSVSEIYIRVTSSKELTLDDRRGLQQALLSGQLSEEDHHCLNRIFHGLQHGHLKLQDCSRAPEKVIPPSFFHNKVQLSPFGMASSFSYTSQIERLAASRDASPAMSR